MAVNAIGIAKLSPVIFCGGNGGGSNEFEAPPGGIQSQYVIPAGNPEGTHIVDAWYQPYDNLEAFKAFEQIRVDREDDQHIVLSVGAYNGASDRMRLLICVLWQQ